MADSKVEARIVIPTGDWTASLTESGGGGAQTITLTAANTYYWSAAGNDSVDLAAKLKALLEAASVTAGNSNTYTVTPALGASGAGTLAISVDAGTFTLTSVNADLLALMGFAGDLTPTASSFTGTKHVESAWLPDCPYDAAVSPIDANTAGNTIAQSSMSMAPDGTFRRFVGSTHIRNTIAWELVSADKTWLSGSPALTGQTLEEFWDDMFNGSEPWAANPAYQVRFFPDAGDDTVSQLYNILNDPGVPAEKPDSTSSVWWRVVLEVAQ